MVYTYSADGFPPFVPTCCCYYGGRFLPWSFPVCMMYHVSETRVGGHSVSVCPHLENTWRFRASPSTYTLARNVLFNPSMLSVFDLTSGHQMSSWLFLVFVAVLIKDRHFSNMNPLQADSLICRLNLTDLQWTAGGRWPSGHWRTVCWWQSSSRPHVGGREVGRKGGRGVALL